MNALDRLFGELRAVAPADFPETARLEKAFAELQLSDNAEVIEEYDRMVEIARRPISLRARVQAILALMEGRRQ
jgi:hypothetical protein